MLYYHSNETMYERQDVCMMGVLETLIFTTALAGVVGTGLGGVLGALLQKDSNRTASLLLSFAGGVMLSVVCFDLIIEAIKNGDSAKALEYPEKDNERIEKALEE